MARTTAEYSGGSAPRPGRWSTERNRRPCGVGALALAALVALPLALVAGGGCGNGGAVSRFNKHANEVLAELNNAKIAMRADWLKPLSEQGDIEETLAGFRKALAVCQEKLDSTDSPEVARPLNDLMSKAVNSGRVLADLAAPYAEFVAVTAPLAKQASDIVVQLQALNKSQYVPSTVANLAEKAGKLEAAVYTLPPNAAFQDATETFKEFATGMVKSLTRAQEVLGEVPTYVPEDERRSGRDEEEGDAESPEEAVNRENLRQIKKIEPHVEPVVEKWGRLEGKIGAELARARVQMGIEGKMAEVEGYIGQAVRQIQMLGKKYG